jgi:hypothetical protein
MKTLAWSVRNMPRARARRAHLHWVLGVLALLGRTTVLKAQATQLPQPVETTPSAPAEPAATAAPVAPSPAPVAPAPAASPQAIELEPRGAVPAPKPPECESPGEPSEGVGMFFIGLGLFDFSDLNHHLRANGYEAIGSPLTLIGGEGHAVLPSGFVMGARGGALLSPDGSGPNGLQRSFGGGFGMLDLGYAFVHERAWLVSLTGGIGGYGMDIGIGDGQSVPFDEVLQNPRRSSSIGRGGLLTGLTLGVDGRVSLGPARNGQNGFFTFGLRVGALYGPPLSGWSLSHGGDATGGPGPGLAGGFAALAIGFGGGRERRSPTQ